MLTARLYDEGAGLQVRIESLTTGSMRVGADQRLDELDLSEPGSGRGALSPTQRARVRRVLQEVLNQHKPSMLAAALNSGRVTELRRRTLAYVAHTPLPDGYVDVEIVGAGPPWEIGIVYFRDDLTAVRGTEDADAFVCPVGGPPVVDGSALQPWIDPASRSRVADVRARTRRALQQGDDGAGWLWALGLGALGLWLWRAGKI
jgi:hypothetical protein